MAVRQHSPVTDRRNRTAGNRVTRERFRRRARRTARSVCVCTLCNSYISRVRARISDAKDRNKICTATPLFCFGCSAVAVAAKSPSASFELTQKNRYSRKLGARGDHPQHTKPKLVVVNLKCSTHELTSTHFPSDDFLVARRPKTP